MTNLSLATPIESIPMVGDVYAKRLNKLNIFTVKDLLYHFPHRHEDLSMIMPIKALSANMKATIQGTVVSAKNVFTKHGKRIQKVIIADNSGQIEATWFNQTYLVDSISKAQLVQLSGEVGFFGNKIGLTSPEYEILKPGSTPIHTGRLVPIYPETYGVSSKWLRSRIFPLLTQIDQILSLDFLPQEIVTMEHLITLKQAIVSIHFPESINDFEKAAKRLSFDELFLLQLASQKRKQLWSQKKLSHSISINHGRLEEFSKSLPFTLTNSQQISVKEILKDLSRNKPMNRLLQGDVGSGKTVVAAMAIFATFQNNLKSVVLAPTGILAEQHLKTLETLFKPFNLKVELITSATHKALKNKLSTSSADIIVGTHALLYTELPNNIGLLIVDEQHRFGVEQRAKLLDFPKTPHLLSMTATPIPRTVALTVYGELDLSIIDEMPKGRKLVKTWVVSNNKRSGAYDWIKGHIHTQKIQAFIVCPLITESESDKLTQVKAAEEEYKTLQNEIFPHLNIGLLHGRMPAKQKNQIIKDFKENRLNILVSTPVIEVGIDIPNANIILIEASERFGLAQLHQLRGRVGRGDQEAFCLLFTSNSSSQNIERLKAMENHHSGFSLSEIDLKLRGPGEMFGLRQHGFGKLKIAKFSDQNLVRTTYKYAVLTINKDPLLSQHKILDQLIKPMLVNQIEPN